jgi:hypothetical protein
MTNIEECGQAIEKHVVADAVKGVSVGSATSTRNHVG